MAARGMSAMGQCDRSLALAAVVSRLRELELEVAQTQLAATRARAMATEQENQRLRDLITQERDDAERDGRDANAVIMALRNRIAVLEDEAGENVD